MAHRVWARALAASDPPPWADAVEHLTVALELLDTPDGTLPGTHTHLDFAELCLAQDDAVGAREHLRLAEARFAALGLDDESRKVRRMLANPLVARLEGTRHSSTDI